MDRPPDVPRRQEYATAEVCRRARRGRRAAVVFAVAVVFLGVAWQVRSARQRHAEAVAEQDLKRNRAFDELESRVWRALDEEVRLTEPRGVAQTEATRLADELTGFLAESNPLRPARRDLIALWLLADLATDDDRPDEQSVSRLETAVSFAEMLSHARPESREARRDLFLTYERLGCACLDRDDSAAAREAFSRASGIVRDASTPYPTAYRHRDLALIQHDLGGCLDSSAAAEQAFREAIALREQLVGERPGEVERRRELWDSYIRFGVWLADHEDPFQGRAWLRLALQTAQRLSAERPERCAERRLVLYSWHRLAAVSRLLGDDRGEREFYANALEIAERLELLFTGEEPARDRLALHGKLARACLRTGDRVAAQEHARSALRLARATRRQRADDALAASDEAWAEALAVEIGPPSGSQIGPGAAEPASP